MCKKLLKNLPKLKKHFIFAPDKRHLLFFDSGCGVIAQSAEMSTPTIQRVKSPLDNL